MLSNQLQQKSATLGNTTTTIVRVIKAFEQNFVGFYKFCVKHSSLRVIPSQGMTTVVL